MTISSKIVSDSINECGNRITTFILRYPRFIHSEFMTHRVFSRNAASSRAIPVKRIVLDILEDPAMPVFWGKTQSGMQAAEELEENYIVDCKREWLKARDKAIASAEVLIGLGLHKQIANRILEPWMHMTTLATATELGNFFNLRVHKDAQPEFQCLAKEMLLAYESSTPVSMKPGEWHIPFGDRDLPEMSLEEKLKVCTARAARTSYQNFEGEIDIKKDIELHDRLATSGHWSPLEHCAVSMSVPERSGNFVGWKQYRKKFAGENNYMFNAKSLIEGVSKYVKTGGAK